MRCVVSVGMLTEGWDAQNVTHTLGLRAFQSQLLCEQVVGRGLRRMNYDFELNEEGVPRHVAYVDVYGVPLELTIPYTFLGGQHVYHPDYLVRLTTGLQLLLEVKGLETEQDRAKHEAARRWVEAVTTWAELGRWAFEVCRDPRDAQPLLRRMAERT